MGNPVYLRPYTRPLTNNGFPPKKTTVFLKLHKISLFNVAEQHRIYLRGNQSTYLFCSMVDRNTEERQNSTYRFRRVFMFVYNSIIQLIDFTFGQHTFGCTPWFPS